MEKSVILGFITTMAADYEGAINATEYDDNVNQFMKFLDDFNLDFGFCNWIVSHDLLTINDELAIICELNKEKPDNYNLIGFYYPTAVLFSSTHSIKEHALKPRLDHLNRTIARLQNEIQQTQQ